MGIVPPYVYPPPSSYSDTDPFNIGFDPKLVSRISLQPPPPSSPKANGPLLDFNRHPDSYAALSYGNLEKTGMSPKTKMRVTSARWIQQGLRMMQLLGAMGMLACVIMVRGTQDTEGWIIRVPPAVDLLTTSYAIYHLTRAAKGRTPASSASYHLFACFMDAGVLPFYVFTVILAKMQHAQPLEAGGRWTSVLPNPPDTQIVLLSTWVIGVIVGSLHIISFAISVYLVMVFRRIARLPLDMNPLEGSLTARPSRRPTKLKSKSSLLTEKIRSPFADHGLPFANLSRPGHQSNESKNHLLAESPTGSRPVSFLTTRQDSMEQYNPHNPNSALMAASAQALLQPQTHLYGQPVSSRSSHVDVSRNDTVIHTKSSKGSLNPNTTVERTSFFIDQGQQFQPGTKPASFLVPSAVPSAVPSRVQTLRQQRSADSGNNKENDSNRGSWWISGTSLKGSSVYSASIRNVNDSPFMPAARSSVYSASQFSDEGDHSNYDNYYCYVDRSDTVRSALSESSASYDQFRTLHLAAQNARSAHNNDPRGYSPVHAEFEEISRTPSPEDLGLQPIPQNQVWWHGQPGLSGDGDGTGGGGVMMLNPLSMNPPTPATQQQPHRHADHPWLNYLREEDSESEATCSRSGTPRPPKHYVGLVGPKRMRSGDENTPPPVPPKAHERRQFSWEGNGPVMSAAGSGKRTFSTGVNVGGREDLDGAERRRVSGMGH